MNAIVPRSYLYDCAAIVRTNTVLIVYHVSNILFNN